MLQSIYTLSKAMQNVALAVFRARMRGDVLPKEKQKIAKGMEVIIAGPAVLRFLSVSALCCLFVSTGTIEP